MTAALVIAPPSPFEAARARLNDAGITLTVREAAPADMPFVEDFLCSYSRPRRTPHADWRGYYKPQARRTIADSKTLIAATDVGGVDVALGLLMLDARKAVRMVYVKLPHRGCGIGMRLLESAGLTLPVRVHGVPTLSWRRWAAGYGMKWEVG
jgi:GNAT superfamily N-acetyltransferase